MSESGIPLPKRHRTRIGTVQLLHFVVESQYEQGRSPLSYEAFFSWPVNIMTSEAPIAPTALQRKVSEGSFAVCCSIVLATGPSLWLGLWLPFRLAFKD